MPPRRLPPTGLLQSGSKCSRHPPNTGASRLYFWLTCAESTREEHCVAETGNTTCCRRARGGWDRCRSAGRSEPGASQPRPPDSDCRGLCGRSKRRWVLRRAERPRGRLHRFTVPDRRKPGRRPNVWCSRRGASSGWCGRRSTAQCREPCETVRGSTRRVRPDTTPCPILERRRWHGSRNGVCGLDGVQRRRSD
ncbi:hypothetical protein BMS3Bbin02_00669 [bacterium BMS3Bbin02]|nr:hypothetical protein BMS3Bbin02_00669 [bacterium BMS3Bbin02]